jgi:hypothetical protein
MLVVYVSELVRHKRGCETILGTGLDFRASLAQGKWEPAFRFPPTAGRREADLLYLCQSGKLCTASVG